MSQETWNKKTVLISTELVSLKNIEYLDTFGFVNLTKQNSSANKTKGRPFHIVLNLSVLGLFVLIIKDHHQVY